VAANVAEFVASNEFASGLSEFAPFAPPTGKSKFDTIADNLVDLYSRPEYKDYELFTTGHRYKMCQGV
jgi:hypothetical protein